MSAITIAAASSPADYGEGRRLIEEYARSLPIDLGFQHFDEEVGALERIYGAPDGCLLLMRAGGAAIGCIAVRRLDAEVCEMKRLYVRPEARGDGKGRTLAEEAIRWARERGYARMRLDTLLSMEAAQRLYRSLGFQETAPYYDNPNAAIFMERSLG